MSQKEWKNINRVYKLSQSSDYYCWSHLHTIAAAHTNKRVDSETADELKEAARKTASCKKDAFKTGSCYCGKFKEVIQ